jgi:Transposase DDE domain
MRPDEVLQKDLDCSLQQVHKRRRDAVWRAVHGVVAGGKLWLTALGRSLSGRTSDKHRIKAADRLLGNKALHNQIALFYRALAKRLLKHIKQPLIVIDWTALGSRHYILSAQLCCDGRSLPVYNRVYPKKKHGNPREQRQFLRGLATILPNDSKPIIITDAGFRSPWFNAVSARGWDFIGRIRNRTKVLGDHGWIAVKHLHELAGSQPRDLGWRWLPRTKPRVYRLVLSKVPLLKGRKRMTRRGFVGRNSTDSKRSSGAREPWLLATSLSSSSSSIVRTYGLRMQIEQSFRDAKNHRHGWSLHHVRSESVKRLEVLLLIASLALIVVQMVGRAACRCDLQRHFQANTVTHRRVLSFFVLGQHVLRRRLSLPPAALLQALREAISAVSFNSSLREHI